MILTIFIQLTTRENTIASTGRLLFNSLQCWLNWFRTYHFVYQNWFDVITKSKLVYATFLCVSIYIYRIIYCWVNNDDLDGPNIFNQCAEIKRIAGYFESAVVVLFNSILLTTVCIAVCKQRQVNVNNKKRSKRRSLSMVCCVIALTFASQTPVSMQLDARDVITSAKKSQSALESNIIFGLKLIEFETINASKWIIVEYTHKNMMTQTAHIISRWIFTHFLSLFWSNMSNSISTSLWWYCSPILCLILGGIELQTVPLSGRVKKHILFAQSKYSMLICY